MMAVMTPQIVLISCVKQKRDLPCKAGEMYTSALFSKMMRYAQSLNPKALYILSAKYGLLDVDEVIEPYEKTLNNMKIEERRSWADTVLTSLADRCDIVSDHFVVLAGQRYREFLVPRLSHTSIPLKGLPLGMQLKWLEEKARV